MQKLLLMSVLIATIVLPVRASRMKSPRLGFKKFVVQMLMYEAFYVFAVRFVYPHL